jgi:hypothetical protein
MPCVACRTKAILERGGAIPIEALKEDNEADLGLVLEEGYRKRYEDIRRKKSVDDREVGSYAEVNRDPIYDRQLSFSSLNFIQSCEEVIYGSE